jgi:hypothetical protein
MAQHHQMNHRTNYICPTFKTRVITWTNYVQFLKDGSFHNLIVSYFIFKYTWSPLKDPIFKLCITFKVPTPNYIFPSS